MATKLYDIVEIELQNGNKAVLKPLPIKALREFMEVCGGIKLGDPNLIAAASKMVGEN